MLAATFSASKEFRMTTVLICEDDAFLAADLSASVESAGHRVVGVYANARDALKGAAETVPDVAFIDLELADGHTGSSIAQSLQAMGVKVVVLSGHPNVGTGLGTVPHTYAAKPISPDMVGLLLNPGSGKRKGARQQFAGPPQATA
jgi:ActR/RegA family two-component response regulator